MRGKEEKEKQRKNDLPGEELKPDGGRKEERIKGGSTTWKKKMEEKKKTLTMGRRR